MLAKKGENSKQFSLEMNKNIKLFGGEFAGMAVFGLKFKEIRCRVNRYVSRYIATQYFYSMDLQQFCYDEVYK